MSACSHLSARTCACSCPRARTCALPYPRVLPPACERRSRKRIASVKPSVNSPRKAASNRQLSTEATITTPHRSTPQMYENHVEIYSDPKFGQPSANSIGFAHIPTKATSRHSSKRGSELGFYNSSVNLDAKPFPRVQFLTRKSVQNVTYSQMQDDFLDLGLLLPSTIHGDCVRAHAWCQLCLRYWRRAHIAIVYTLGPVP